MFPSNLQTTLQQPGSVLISIEKNPLYAAIATKIIEFAGLSNCVKVLVGTADTKLPTLKERYGIDGAEVVFLDHWKDRYLPDLRILEETKLLRKGCIIIADNVIIPGMRFLVLPVHSL
jgi:catechol O-methyltransferase